MKAAWMMILLIGLLAGATALVMFEYSKPVKYAEISGVIMAPEDRPDQRVLLLDGSGQPFLLQADRVDHLVIGQRFLLRGIIQTHFSSEEGKPTWSFSILVKQVEDL